MPQVSTKKKRLVIYGRQTCPFTISAKELAKKDKRFAVKYCDINNIPKYRKDILDQMSHTTVPAIFLENAKKNKSSFIGGRNDLARFLAQPSKILSNE